MVDMEVLFRDKEPDVSNLSREGLAQMAIQVQAPQVTDLCTIAAVAFHGFLDFRHLDGVSKCPAMAIPMVLFQFWSFRFRFGSHFRRP